MKVDKSTRDLLLDIQKLKRVSLEGNILKVIEAEPGDDEFSKYIKDCLEKDKETRRRRLDITKQVQTQNKDLLASQVENERINEELKETLEVVELSNKDLLASQIENERINEELKNTLEVAELAKKFAEDAKDAALDDLEIIQKKSQTELISTIVKVALYVIMGVGVTTTIMYGIALFSGADTQIIGSTWSNMFGILLTNAFSIVGTIMGVKYASEKKE
jgi:hypothetical protein